MAVLKRGFTGRVHKRASVVGAYPAPRHARRQEITVTYKGQYDIFLGCVALRRSMGHGDVARRVREAVASDPAALDALERGILNVRAYGRWLLESRRWDVTEEAVVSALRRFEGDRQYGQILARAKEVLRESRISVHEGMLSVALRNSPQVQERLSGLFSEVDTSQGERIRVMSSDQGFKIIVDEPAWGRMRAVVGDESILETKRGLTELDVALPARARSVPGLLAVISSALAAANVNIAEIVDGVSQHIILVDRGDAVKTYQVLKGVAAP